MNMPANGNYSQVKEGLELLGYRGSLLREDYSFADILGSAYSLCTIPLATFAQEPPSYQNACFGVVISNGQSGVPLVARYRSLGAPHIIEVKEGEIRRWMMTSQGDPKLLEVISPEQITGLFEHHKQDWSPDQILRAKSMGEEDFATQLDFFDVGLLPLIDGEVHEKLDTLLRRTVLSSVEQYKARYPHTEPDYPGLVRLLFRLIAAKILNDRNYPGNWLNEDPRIVVKAVEGFYFREPTAKPVLGDYATQVTAWNSIRSAFYFQNLSVEALAHVYENTFVSKELRSLYSIHGTPPYVAEYIVRHLPFEKLGDCERVVFEPFAGHAVFLVAAMRRLRELLPSPMSAEERHEYFVQRLSGIEKEEFAWEVGRLSLMLADYPNPNGWRLVHGDAFQDPVVDKEIERAGIVLCNPPFEDFTMDERHLYTNLHSVHKPIEILHRIITHPQRPRLLGFVLPRTFITGQVYRDLRTTVSSAYGRLELVALPDRVFRHSDAEAVLLLAEGKPTDTIRITSALVDEDDLPIFRRRGTVTYRTERDIATDSMAKGDILWEPPLSQVWHCLRSYERFGAIAEVHRGIEYNIPLRLNREKFVSSHLQEGFQKGIDNVERGFEPYVIQDFVFLKTSPDVMRRKSYLYPWNRPKVVANAARLSRGPWRIAASLDSDGLVCYKNFFGIWPRNEFSIEVLAALLNSPIANAYLWTYDARENRKVTVEDIPIPNFDEANIEILINLVRTYMQYRRKWLVSQSEQDRIRDACRQLLAEIDAVILRAYNLPPKLERQLLDCFRGHFRPGPIEFTGYYPNSFKPFIPWYRYISREFQRARIDETLSRMPVIDDPNVSEALSEL